jgi:septum formation protein
MVSGVDEDALVQEKQWTNAHDVSLGLAIAKAEFIAQQNFDQDVIIIGCDSVMEFDDGIHGKPLTVDNARTRLHAMKGGRGWLHTGHCVIFKSRDGQTQASTVAKTEVVFHDMTDAEIEAYLETGEPLQVAGSFTIDSLGGPFIREIHGDPSTVVGLSLPTLRQLFADLGFGWEKVLKQSAAN